LKRLLWWPIHHGSISDPETCIVPRTFELPTFEYSLDKGRSGVGASCSQTMEPAVYVGHKNVFIKELKLSQLPWWNGLCFAQLLKSQVTISLHIKEPGVSDY